MAPRDEVITAGQLRERLAGLEGWHGDTSGISKDYRVDYDTAIHIVAEIGKAAVELEHRPDIDIRWDRLHVFMTTHTAGDVVTELDFRLRLDRQTWEKSRDDTPCTVTGVGPYLAMFGLGSGELDHASS